MASLLIGCSSNNNKGENENRALPDPITLNDFIGFLKIISNNINTGESNAASSFFPDTVNSQVKVKGTNKTLLVDQAYLDAEDIPEYISITLVTRTVKSDGDITFEGQAFVTQKSLIENIKTAIASNPKEIEQSTIDAQKFTFLIENISFTTTFHLVNNSYIQPPSGQNEEYDLNRAVPVEDTDYILLALKNHLDANAQDLPDQVIVYLIDQPTNIQTEINMSGEFVLVPKSVIADMKTALTNPPGTIARNNSTWHTIASFNIDIELSTSSN